MQVIFGNENKTKLVNSLGVGLGNFDGLHTGHMTLINTLIEETRRMGIDSVLYTFSKHPEHILRKKLNTPLLTTINKKIEILEKTSLDYIYFDKFDESFSRIRPEAFIKDILVDKLNIKLAVTGFDYRFGYKGQGDVNMLEEAGKKFGFKVIIIPPVKIDGEIVSSTSIRHSIDKGNIEKANNYLKRRYSISGKVVKGRQIGNTIGFPTANILPLDYIVIPQKGVYITQTLFEGELFNSVTSIGMNPTFKDVSSISIETYLLDFNNDIYGKNIEVFFLKRIRKEKAFGSVEELVKQIKDDVLFAREFFTQIESRKI
ncbi:MAG: bifunctional riboflavin kinase/FAD synthetase [Bacillota bacterium]|nr:bifunctional riboflavin kinase/FAD synthetase [Bacillota bacterium]